MQLYAVEERSSVHKEFSLELRQYTQELKGS